MTERQRENIVKYLYDLSKGIVLISLHASEGFKEGQAVSYRFVAPASFV